MTWQLWAVVSAVAAGVTAVFAKAGLEGVPSHLANAVRTAIVLALSIGVVVASGEHQTCVRVDDASLDLSRAVGGGHDRLLARVFQGALNRRGNAGDRDRQGEYRGHAGAVGDAPARSSDLEDSRGHRARRGWAILVSVKPS